MNKKAVLIVLVLIVLLSFGTLLVISVKPELTVEWNSQTKALFKQYVKIIGFLSVMALVYLRLENSKSSKIEDDNL